MLLFYLFNSKSLAGERKSAIFVAVKLCKVAVFRFPAIALSIGYLSNRVQRYPLFLV
jgi:hypothetical protein